MSGEPRRFGGWLLPVIVVMVGAYVLLTSGSLRPIALRPVQWAGIAAMAAGAVATIAVRKNPLVRLAGVIVCGIGAILVICL